MGRVYSINDFKEGLDVRKTALTAPAGSLRILDNAVVTPGGEIEKRKAFVKLTTLPAGAGYIFGQRGVLHVFGITGMGAIDPGTCPVPIQAHELPPPAEGFSGAVEFRDVTAFDDGFYVLAQDAAGALTIWWNGVVVRQTDGSRAQGIYLRTYKTKMYRADGRYLRFSGVNDPSVEDPASVTAPGAGFINMSINDPDGEFVQGLEVFYDKVAVFHRLATQVWTLDPDPTNDTLQQVVRIGTCAPYSILQFGTGDVLFLSDSGVRSLKSQTVTVTAAVADVGSAIDPLMTELIRQRVNMIYTQAVVQPISGRYWLSDREDVYVLSFFPAGSITAWSHFALEFVSREWATVDNRLFTRSDDNGLWLYGGVDDVTYDSCPVTVRTPHMELEGPTERKYIQSVDVMCQGQWKISMGMLPNNVDAFETVATVTDNTFGLQSIPFAGYGTHVGIEMTHQAPGPAILASIHLNVREASTK